MMQLHIFETRQLRELSDQFSFVFLGSYMQFLLGLKVVFFTFKSLNCIDPGYVVSTCLPVDCGVSDEQRDWIH